jgi:large subunit ribosomal protein L3
VEAAPPVAAVSEDAPEEVPAEETPAEENSLKLPFILGTKLGMTQIFSDNGTVYPTAVIEAGPCNITQIKTIEKDGYDAVQIGYLDVKESKMNKPSLGHFNKSKSSPKKHLKEFRYTESDDISLGEKITLSQFDIGDILQITGVSKGKGFAGHMKRHNFVFDPFYPPCAFLSKLYLEFDTVL